MSLKPWVSGRGNWWNGVPDRGRQARMGRLFVGQQQKRAHCRSRRRFQDRVHSRRETPELRLAWWSPARSSSHQGGCNHNSVQEEESQIWWRRCWRSSRRGVRKASDTRKTNATGIHAAAASPWSTPTTVNLLQLPCFMVLRTSVVLKDVREKDEWTPGHSTIVYKFLHCVTMLVLVKGWISNHF